MAEFENNYPEQGNDFEQPAELPVEQPETFDAEKTPFAQNDTTLSGMVSSVLKPQDDGEREKIEHDLKKHQEKLKQPGKKFSLAKILPVLLIVVLLAGAALFVFNKIGKTKTGFNAWGAKHVVFNNTFRLKVKSSSTADKATMIINDGAKSINIAGLAVYGMEEQVLTWEFLASDLAKRKYTYKVFVKNSASGELKELRGSFELK